MGKIVREAPPKRPQADEGGAAIEYALLAALIAGVLLVGLSALGASLDQKFSQLGSAMDPSQSASSSSGGSGGNNGNGKGGNGNGNNGNGNGNGGPAA